MTRNNRSERFTIEKLTHDCLDIRFLRREGFFADDWVTIGATLKWPNIAQMRIARYRLILDLRGHGVPQQIRVSWTRVHLGGERPWMHCPHCQTRVARLYAGLGGYFCRAFPWIDPVRACRTISALNSHVVSARPGCARHHKGQ